MMLFSVLTMNMDIIIFNIYSNNDRASVLGDTISDNDTLKHDDIDGFITRRKYTYSLPSIEEIDDNNFNLDPISDKKSV